MRALFQSVVLKRELSGKAKFSIYSCILIPNLTYDHKIWVMTERMRLQIQVAETSFPQTVAGISLRGTVKSSTIRR